ncbi:MAG: hypothetical protein PHC47_03265 [Clostridia bacterium]|jgi:hypothetical protein|nr:hypothetical protein [Clostridia bacterium]
MHRIVNFGRVQSQAQFKKQLIKLCLYTQIREDLDDDDLVRTKNTLGKIGDPMYHYWENANFQTYIKMFEIDSEVLYTYNYNNTNLYDSSPINFNLDESLDIPLYNYFDSKLNILAVNTYVVGNYKGENFELIIDNLFSLRLSFPLRSKILLNEILPIISSFIKEKPIGFYDVEIINNTTKNTRTVLWNTLAPDIVRKNIANKFYAPFEYIFEDGKHVITKAELCDGHKKTSYQQTGQTVLFEELVR